MYVQMHLFCTNLKHLNLEINTNHINYRGKSAPFRFCNKASLNWTQTMKYPNYDI